MSLRPFLSSRKTLLSGGVTALGAAGAILQHLLAVADGEPLRLEILFTAVMAIGGILTSFFAKDADKTGVSK
jgi:hypothetical protein